MSSKTEVLKGIHNVKARLASGNIRIYHYAWRGGALLTAAPGTPEFIAQYNDAHASVRQPKHGTMMTIIAQFKTSADYDRLSQSSKRVYLSYLKLIENEFGDLPVAALSDRRVRGDFKAWRDSFFGNAAQGRLCLDDTCARHVVCEEPRPN